ncbi:MAG: hypothetical protein GX271_00615 [Clostridiales bacterium]|nr:hypothetical protein [Clostridiales bacterium]
MIVKRRRIFIVATFLVVAAIAVVLCVGYFTEEKKTDYDGILAHIEYLELGESAI